MRLPHSFYEFFPLFLSGIVYLTVLIQPAYAKNITSKNIYDHAKPSLTTFTSVDGLPVNAVMSMERDGRGFIWFGTQDGAAYFDGYDFTVVNMPNRAVSNYIQDIMAAKDGSIWFATTNGGVHRLKDDEWKTFDTDSGLASNETRVLLESFDNDGEQVIWIGRRSGVSKLKGNKIENFDEKDGLPDKRVRCVIETVDKSGEKSIWIGTYGGIAVWKGNEKKTYTEKNGFPAKVVFRLLEVIDDNGKSIIWAATDKGILRFKDGEWESFGDVSEVLTKTVRGLGKSVKKDGTETIWVGTDGAGLAYFEDGQWFFLDKEDGLPSNLVHELLPTGAPDGSVWISNLGSGVARLERSNWRTLNNENGLKNNIVFTAAETTSSNGEPTYWIATYGGGLASFSEGKWAHYDSNNKLKDNFVQSLFVMKDNTGEEVLYVGTETGLVSWKNGVWKNEYLGKFERQTEIWGIAEHKNANGEKAILLSTNLGLFVKNGEEVKLIDTSAGLPDEYFRGSFSTSDDENSLWIASYNAGLIKKDGENWKVFDKNKGLLTNRTYSANEIKYGNKRELWVGTGGGGIAILDLDKPDSEIQILTTENSNLIPSDTVYSIFQDSNQRIYVTTNRGVSRIVPDKSGDITKSQAYFFTTKDGLPNNECTSGAGFIDSKNRVWIGTVGGVAILDLDKEFKDEKADPLFLQTVFVDGEKRKLIPNSTISYSENNLTFEYVMPTNFRESGTLYRTQLINLEDEPTEWTREPRREFTFIPSGEYVFKIWAKDASGNVSKPLEIPFIINQPWWLTWWAFLLYLLAILSIIAFIAYLYRNRYRRMLEIERVRTRIATDLHDDVGASLSKISILSEVLAQSKKDADEDEKNALQSIADTSREVVGSMSDMVWSINPNRDNMRDTVQRMRRFANEVLSAKDIEFTFNAPKDDREIKLDVDLRRQIYLVFKESLNNCVKYSDCTKVEIELKRNSDGILLRVTDNGKGFELNGLRRGNGLNNMKKRAEEMGGTFDISSEIGKGTTVTLKLPRRLGGLSFSKTT